MQDFLADRLLLDAIVTVIDAKHIEQHLDDKKPDGVENEVSFFPNTPHPFLGKCFGDMYPKCCIVPCL